MAQKHFDIFEAYISVFLNVCAACGHDHLKLTRAPFIAVICVLSFNEFEFLAILPAVFAKSAIFGSVFNL